MPKRLCNLHADVEKMCHFHHTFQINQLCLCDVKKYLLDEKKNGELFEIANMFRSIINIKLNVKWSVIIIKLCMYRWEFCVAERSHELGSLSFRSRSFRRIHFVEVHFVADHYVVTIISSPIISSHSFRR